MSQQTNQRPVARSELFTGSVIAAVGFLAVYQALGFDAASRMFPAVASGLLALVGAAISVLAIVRPDDTVKVVRGCRVVVLACVVIAFWAIALNGGAGFVIPTFTMQVFLLRLTGLHRWSMLIGVAALVTTLAYLLFVVLLEVPLPPSRLPPMLEAF